jgi:hypothetical protein
MAKGEALRGTPTEELMAEVRALAMRGQASLSQGQSTTPSTDLNANAVKLGNGNRGNSGGNSGGKWKKNRGNKMGQPYNKDKGGQGNNNGSRRDSHDPNEYCTHHQRVGHTIFECRDAKK